jgi:hypothetical protein
MILLKIILAVAAIVLLIVLIGFINMIVEAIIGPGF